MLRSVGSPSSNFRDLINDFVRSENRKTFMKDVSEAAQIAQPVQKKEQKQEQITKSLPDLSSLIDNLSRLLSSVNNSGSSSSTDSTTTTDKEEAVIDVFTMDITSGGKYDLDADQTGETAHSLVTEAGVLINAPEANIHFQSISDSAASAVTGLQKCLELAKNNKIDAAYFSLGYYLNTSEVSEILGRNITTEQLSDPSIMAELRDKIVDNAYLLPSIRQTILLLEEIQKYIPVYISAGNEPESINAWVLAEGSNIHKVGTYSSYSSPYYTEQVQTDYVWTKLSTGFDINGDGTVDYEFSSQSDEGYDLANGTKLSIAGGTSLGSAIALGRDIKNGLIKDRESLSVTA